MPFLQQVLAKIPEVLILARSRDEAVKNAPSYDPTRHTGTIKKKFQEGIPPLNRYFIDRSRWKLAKCRQMKN